MLFCAVKPKKTYRHYFSLLFLLVGIVFLVHSVSNIATTSTEKSKQLLNNALTRSITQCYALEGAYPSNLEYLCNHYGLTYDQNCYYIDYRYIGANLRPDVTIIERKTDE